MSTASHDSQAIVKSIIDLAANIDLDCVAEGVETEETAALLEQLGVLRPAGLSHCATDGRRCGSHLAGAVGGRR